MLALCGYNSLFALDPIKVGMSLDLEGPSKALGKELLVGSTAYIKHINSKGGVYGRQVQLVVKNDGSEPNQALKNSIHFIEKDQVSILYGYMGAATVTKVIPLLKANESKHIPLLFPYSGSQSIREFPYVPFVYNYRASTKEEINTIVARLTTLKRKKIAIFFQSDAYGRNAWDALRKALKKQGLSIHSEASYNSHDQDSFSEHANIIYNSNADAVLTIGSAKAVAYFIKELKALGSKATVAMISSVGSNIVLDHLKQFEFSDGRNYSEGVLGTEVVPEYATNALFVAKQYNILMKRYFPDHKKSRASFESFISAKFLVTLLNQSKKEGPALMATLSTDQPYDIGLSQPLSFAKPSNQASTFVQLQHIHKNKWRAYQ